jgi:threonyl-tRNA synthetase
MFFAEIEGREFAVKPMNCPGHCLMFSEKKWSYRELPMRFADFGRLHRFERSGVMPGLTRVRSFCQDDAHIFCTPDQMGSESEKFLDLVNAVYRDFEFSDVKLALATRPEKSIGDAQVWERAETTLANAMKSKNMDFVINKGEGAFYGPKIEFQVKDALGRPWQLGTLQVDFSMPERFELGYFDSQHELKRPVMLHRAILGSIERFLGVLIEHCAGAFPFWLAPTQIKVLTITDGVAEYGQKVIAELQNQKLRVELDARNEKLGLKIREAQLEKVPYMLVIGEKEKANGQVSVRHRHKGDLGTMSLTALHDLLGKEKNMK